MRILVICSLVLLAGCKAEDVIPSVFKPTVSVSTDAGKWQFENSPNMPASPFPNAAGGWYFDFPSVDGVHYLTTNVSGKASGMVSAHVAINVTGSPFFDWRTNANNTCDYASHARLYLQRSGDNGSGEDYRWFSNPIALKLEGTNYSVLNVPLDSSQWSNVYGRMGNTRGSSFNDAIASLQRVGWVFGGGCFHGHGVFVTGGTAQFVNTNYTIQ